MIQISKTIFQEMFSLGILKGSREKNWTVTSRQKPARRKKRYVDQDQWNLYLLKKNNNPS